jgi:hypothetical protein
MYCKYDIEAPWYHHSCRGRGSIDNSKRIYIPATFLLRIILLFVASLAVPYFQHFLIEGTILEKKNY